MLQGLLLAIETLVDRLSVTMDLTSICRMVLKGCIQWVSHYKLLVLNRSFLLELIPSHFDLPLVLVGSIVVRDLGFVFEDRKIWTYESRMVQNVYVI